MLGFIASESRPMRSECYIHPHPSNTTAERHLQKKKELMENLQSSFLQLKYDSIQPFFNFGVMMIERVPKMNSQAVNQILHAIHSDLWLEV